MATAMMAHDADRKRAYAVDSFQPLPGKIEFSVPTIELISPTPRYPAGYYTTGDNYRRRGSPDRLPRAAHRTGMQVPPSPRTFAAPMPSFMTVFDEDSTRRELEDLTSQHASEVQKPFPSNPTAAVATNGRSEFAPITSHFSKFHHPRESISTSTSDSSESSPTTTVSTLDSSSMTEPSPGPSPETPASTMALNYAPISEAKFHVPMRTATEPIGQHFFDMQQRPTTPAKKPRNLKNLAVNTTSAYNLGRAILSAPFVSSDQRPKERTSAPNSPVFVKPPTPPRRKLGGGLNLTIKTPANANMSIGGIIPPTPSVTKPNTLRHFQSSPSLPLLTSRDGPLGGMTLPQLKTKPAPRGFADIPIEDEEDENEQNFDVPQSQEEKPDSYPNGPIRIYEDGVDLYYEPDCEVASRYDCIFNVASEVKNPFTVAAEAARLATTNGEVSQNVGMLAEGAENSSSPDTPKATPISTALPAPPLPTKMPEYIHIPWEHNTDLVPDLHRLVKVIDEKVKEGKRVLVHCQCGVSRSATLIVAYGIYKNPGITVQEAYDAVKKRSKWIGPNMNLIMQLQEFRSGLLRNSRGGQLFNLPRKLSTGMSSASTSESFNATSKSTPITPRTAPLPPEKDGSSPNRARTASMGPLSAAPLEPRQPQSWESGFRRSWGEGQQITTDVDMKRISIVSDTPYVDPKGHIVPMVHVIQHDDDTPKQEVPSALPAIQLSADIPARSKSQKRKTPNFSRQLPLRKDFDGDSPMADPSLPPVPDILSPRNEEFGMIGVAPAADRNEDDSFGLFSPMKTEFPEFPSTSFITRAAPTSIQPFPSLVDSPPRPAQEIAPAVRGFSFFEQPSTSSQHDPLLSIMSPTTSSFPRELPFRAAAFPAPQPSRIVDESRLTPRKNAPHALKTKFSSPNLQESRRLARLQNEIDMTTTDDYRQRRHMDDLDALMSPRATQFTANPFHDLLAVRAEGDGDTPVGDANDGEEKGLLMPVTPTSAKTDPRSPPPLQLGSSPITRNIFDVL